MKKLLAILLCAAMLLGVCVTVNALSSETEIDVGTQSALKLKDTFGEMYDYFN